MLIQDLEHNHYTYSVCVFFSLALVNAFKEFTFKICLFLYFKFKLHLDVLCCVRLYLLPFLYFLNCHLIQYVKKLIEFVCIQKTSI